MEKQSPQPVCGQEALDLINCVTESSYDQEKCLRFLQSLRECVLSKCLGDCYQQLCLSLYTLNPRDSRNNAVMIPDKLKVFLLKTLEKDETKVKKFSIPSQDRDNEGAASATKRPS